MFVRFIREESGATVLEYGLIATIISICAVAVMREVGTQLSETFQIAASEMRSS